MIFVLPYKQQTNKSLYLLILKNVYFVDLKDSLMDHTEPGHYWYVDHRLKKLDSPQYIHYFILLRGTLEWMKNSQMLEYICVFSILQNLGIEDKFSSPYYTRGMPKLWSSQEIELVNYISVCCKRSLLKG